MKKITYWLIGLFVYLFIFTEFFHPITAFTQDLGRHLLLGKIILQTHTVPKTNLFSYTYPNFPFINTHWLSEVIFYLITQILGLPGLLFVMSCVAALSVLLIVFMSFRGIAEKSHSKIFALILVTMVSSGILLERTDLRPEIFSFLFMSIFLWILWRNRHYCHAGSKPKNNRENSLTSKIKNPTSILFLLPILEILWVNMHIYFIIGPLLIFLFLVDTCILHLKQRAFSFSEEAIRGIPHKLVEEGVKSPDQRLKKSSSTFMQRAFDTFGGQKYAKNKNVLFLLFLFLLTCLATLLNPNGLSGALYPFTVFHNYGYTIEENQSLFFLLNYGIYRWSYLFLGLGVVGLLVLLWIQFKHTRPIDWLLFVAFSYIGASAIRNLPLFALATLPTYMYLLCNSSLRGVTTTKQSQKEIITPSGLAMTESNSFLALLIPLAFFIFLLYLFISQNGLGYAISPGAEKGADFFLTNNLSGPMFNNFDIGSYLNYRFYPQTKVFVDGRPEAYPSSFFQNIYIPMQQDPKIFAQQDQKYHFQTIFFSYTDQTPWARTFLQTIMQEPRWSLVYLDTFSAIWVKNDPKNQQIIKHFGLTQQNFSLTHLSITNPKDYLRLGYFLSLANWQQQLLTSMQRLLIQDPNNCSALGILMQNPNLSPLYSQRYFDHCR